MKANFRQILEKLNSIDFSKHVFNCNDVVDIDVFDGEFTIPTSEIHSKYWESKIQLHEYPIWNWVCTDTHVGMYAIIFNGQVVAITYQAGRRMDRQIEWISVDMFNKVNGFVMSLLELKSNSIDIINLDEEFDMGRIEYSSQLLVKEVWYKDELCRVDKTYWEFGNINLWGFVDIEYGGAVITVEMSDIEVPTILNPIK